MKDRIKYENNSCSTFVFPSRRKKNRREQKMKNYYGMKRKISRPTMIIPMRYANTFT